MWALQWCISQLLQKKKKTASTDIYWCVVKGFEKTMISIFKDLTLHLCCQVNVIICNEKKKCIQF